MVLRVLLGVVLLATLALFSVRWWVEPAVNAALPTLLKSLPIEDAQVRVRNIGLAQSNIQLTLARMGAITVRDTQIEIDYALEHLQRQSVDEVIVRHPQVTVDLAKLMKEMAKPSSGKPVADQVALPSKFPLAQVTVEGAAIRLVDEGWERTFNVGARATLQDRAQITVRAESDGDQFSLQGVGDLAKRLGRIRANATLSEWESWLALARQMELPVPDMADEVRLKQASARLDAHIDQAQLADWSAHGTIAELHAPLPDFSLQVAEANLTATGAAARPDSVAVEAHSGKVRYEELALQFDKASLRSAGDSALSAELADWSAKGKAPVAALGNVQVSGGNVHLRALGPWADAVHGLSLGDWGFELESPSAPFDLFTGLGSLSGELAMTASIGSGDVRSVSGQLSVASAAAGYRGFLLDAERLKAEVSGSWPGDLWAKLSLDAGELSWGQGSGLLEGLSGALDAVSLTPVSISQPQTLTFDRFQQGELTASEGKVSVTYTPQQKPAFLIKLEALALEGRMDVTVTGSSVSPLTVDINARFDRVSLESLAALLPDFDGRITGTVSGNLAIRLDNGKLVLKPGYLQLTPNTSGRFQYFQQGWLTQRPDLNPEEFVKSKDFLALMQDSQKVTTVVEYAMRDLLMTSFRMDVLKTGVQKPVEIVISGEREVKGVKIPVTMNIPVSGDVKETLNIVLKLQSKM